MIGESGVGTGTDSAESNLPGATCIRIVDGGACTNGASRTGIGTDLAELNLPRATISPRIDGWIGGQGWTGGQG